MVQILAAEPVFQIWYRSGQKGQGQTKKSGSDPNICIRPDPDPLL
jgi:hypothetical protein